MSAAAFILAFFMAAIVAAPTVSNFDPQPRVEYIYLLVFAFCGAWPCLVVFLMNARRYHISWGAVIACGLLSGLGFVAGLATVYVHHNFLGSVGLGFALAMSIAGFWPVAFGYKLTG